MEEICDIKGCYGYNTSFKNHCDIYVKISNCLTDKGEIMKAEKKGEQRNELVKYVRDKKGNLIGCLIGIKENGKVRIGFSKYHEKNESEPFSKDKAKSLARSRAKNSELWTVRKEWNKKWNSDSFTPCPNFPESMKGEMGIFTERCMKFFEVEEISNAYKIKAVKEETIKGTNCILTIDGVSFSDAFLRYLT